MDVDKIAALIGTLGFPIVCCAALFWRMLKSDENHKEEIDKLSEALNNNTQALVQLTAHIKGVD